MYGSRATSSASSLVGRRADDPALNWRRHPEAWAANSYEDSQADYELDSLEGANRGHGKTDVEMLREQLQALRMENLQLKEQLRRSPSSAASMNVQQLQEELADVKLQLEETRAQLSELQRQSRLWHEGSEGRCGYKTPESTKQDALSSQCDRLDGALSQSRADFDALLTEFRELKAATPSPRPSPPLSNDKPIHSELRGQSLFLTPPVASPPKSVEARLSDESPQQHKSSPPVVQPVRLVPASPSPPRHSVPPPKWKGLELFDVLGIEAEIRENCFDSDDGIIGITAVRRGSLAEKAGLRIGDRIDKWNHRFIDNRKSLMEVLHKTSPGSCLRLSYHRTGIRKQALIDIP